MEMTLHRLPYAKLLVKMYEFPKSSYGTIADFLTHDDMAAIDTAVEALAYKKHGKAMQTVLQQYYVRSALMWQVAQFFNPPITTTRAFTLRTMAFNHLCCEGVMRPVYERIAALGIVGESMRKYRTLELPTAGEVELLKEAAVVPVAPVSVPTGTFMLDCFPHCTRQNPCPSCRARKLLNDVGISAEVIQLASEWSQGPDTSWRNVSVRSVGLSRRTVNCLYNEEIFSLGQLCAKSERELLMMPNFGRKSLEEITTFLTSINQQLRT